MKKIPTHRLVTLIGLVAAGAALLLVLQPARTGRADAEAVLASNTAALADARTERDKYVTDGKTVDEYIAEREQIDRLIPFDASGVFSIEDRLSEQVTDRATRAGILIETGAVAVTRYSEILEVPTLQRYTATINVAATLEQFDRMVAMLNHDLLVTVDSLTYRAADTVDSPGSLSATISLWFTSRPPMG